MKRFGVTFILLFSLVLSGCSNNNVATEDDAIVQQISAMNTKLEDVRNFLSRDDIKCALIHVMYTGEVNSPDLFFESIASSEAVVDASNRQYEADVLNAVSHEWVISYDWVEDKCYCFCAYELEDGVSWLSVVMRGSDMHILDCFFAADRSGG